MQQRWLGKLLGYEFVVQYIKGNENRVANALSRQGKEKISLLLLSMPTLGWVKEIKKTYEQDPKLLQLVAQCQQGSLNPHYSLREGLLFY